MFKYIRTAIILAVISIIFSCSQFSDLQVPETVSVKTNADYSAPLGTYTKSLSDYISVDKLKDELTDSAGGSGTDFNVYDYNPGGNSSIQEYLVEYPLYNYELDFEQEFGDIAADSGFTQEGSYTLNVDPVNQDFSSDFTISSSDLTSEIGSPTLSDTSLSLPEASSSTSIPEVSSQITISGMDSVTYSSGTLEVTLAAQSDTTDTKDITVTLEKNGTTLTSASGSSSPSSDDITVSLPLTGKTLYSSMDLVINGTVSGGTDGNSDDYTISIAFDSTVYSEITGITTSTPISKSISQTVDLGITQVASATIGTGSLSVDGTAPSGWSGVTCAVGSLSLADGITTTSSFEDGSGTGLFSKTLDLSDALLDPSQTVALTGTAAVSLNDATVTFDAAGDATVQITGNCSVTELAEAEITVDSGDVPSFTINQNLSTLDFADAVKSVQGATLTVSGTYVNGLPADAADTAANEVTLHLSSTYLSLTGDAATGLSITAGGDEITSVDTSTQRDITVADDTIDLTASLLLPGQTASTDNATFKNITLGTDYTMSASFRVAMDWTSVTVDGSSVATLLNQTGTQDIPIDLDSLLEKVPAEIGLSSLPVYLYVVAPQDVRTAFSSSASAALTADYTYDDNGTSTDVTGATVLNGSLSLLDSGPDLGDSSETYTGTISDITNSATTSLVDIVNNRPSTMVLNYSIDLGSGSDIQIVKTALDSATISVTAVIEVPLELTVSDDIDMTNLFETFDVSTTDDIFGRDEATDTSDIDKYIAAIKEAAVKYSMAVPVDDLSATFTLSAPLTGGPLSGQTFEKELTLSGSEVSLTTDEIESILATWPFVPTLRLQIPKPTDGTISVPRDADFSFNGTVSISTDGTVTLFGEDN